VKTAAVHLPLMVAGSYKQRCRLLVAWLGSPPTSEAVLGNISQLVVVWFLVWNEMGFCWKWDPLIYDIRMNTD
jgi:hypothetical protein